VSAVGAAVKDLAPGAKVLTFGPGCLSTELCIDRKWVHELPADMDLDAAATIPVAFFTAFYALDHLARLSSGETVLIHGAAGGVGLAAIQIARWQGATVIATAGSPTKRAFLKSLGVAHVLNSRDLAFADRIRSLTGGKGVDVVLNALAGPAMEASLQSLAPFGRFLELGKQDFYANTGIGLRPLKENISYFGIDVDQLLAEKPGPASRVFAEMMARFTEGDFTPLPHRRFNAPEVGDAFRLMQKSGHIGKIVVSPEGAGACPGTQGFQPDADGVHIVIGGLGGLGVATGRWLVARGARHLVLVGRSGAPDPQTLDWIGRMAGLGVEISCAACDVADGGAVADLLASIRERRRIAGIIHSAMVLDDRMIADLSEDVITKTLSAKVAGLAHLDRLTREAPLDYFVAYSSVAAMIGNHGQGAYVAANAFAEGVMRRRVRAGLPGLAIGFGPISDAGYLTRDEEKAALLRRVSGKLEFTSRQALSALENLLGQRERPSNVYVTPMSWKNANAVLPTLAEPMLTRLRLLGQRAEGAGHGDDLRDRLIALPAAEAEAHLVKYLMHQITQILHIPEAALPTDQPVADLGMDSLMGVELGLSVQEVLGSDISISAISSDQSIQQIASNIVRHLQSGRDTESGLDKISDHLASQHLSAEQAQEAAIELGAK